MTEKIEKSLYNGEVDIVFYPNSHQYKIGKERILSVSTICGIVDKSGPLIHRATNLAKEYMLSLDENKRTDEEIFVACNMHRTFKEESANIGTQAHEWVENFIKKEEVTIPEDARVANAVQGFIDRKSSEDIKFLESEKFVYSKKYNYCGIMDLLVEIDGKKYLADIKTSNNIYPLEYGMQTCAYAHAYEEETGEKIDGIFVVKFAKDEFDNKGNPLNTFEIWNVENREELFEAFIGAKILKEAHKKFSKFRK